MGAVWSWEVERFLSIHARDAVGHLTTFRRDGGLITAIETPGRATAFSYDEHGNQTRAVDSLAGETVYTHDNLGRITTATDARGGVTRFVHDLVGKTIGVQRANGGSINIGLRSGGLPYERLNRDDDRNITGTATIDAWSPGPEPFAGPVCL